jgi:ATP-dependent DNA helicase PIF1
MFPKENVIILDQVFRQKEDSFLSALHEIRRGEVSLTTRSLLERKCREGLSDNKPVRSMDGSSGCTVDSSRLAATKLFSTNRDVDRVNDEELGRLGGKEKVFHAHDEGPDVGLLKGMRAPEVLKLKVGAQVMLLKNLDVSSGLVNGTRGEVVHFERSEKRSNLYAEVPVVRFEVSVGDQRSYETRTIIEESWEIGSSKTKLVAIQCCIYLNIYDDAHTVSTLTSYLHVYITLLY